MLRLGKTQKTYRDVLSDVLQFSRHCLPCLCRLAHSIEELEGQRVPSLFSWNLQRPDCVIKIMLMTNDAIYKDLVPEKVVSREIIQFQS